MTRNEALQRQRTQPVHLLEKNKLKRKGFHKGYDLSSKDDMLVYGYRKKKTAMK